MRSNDTKHNVTLEPALVNETRGGNFLSLSARAFREKVDAGEITRIRIPGLRRVAYDVEELRTLARRWKNRTGDETA